MRGRGLLLAIETSCDETSVAVIDLEKLSDELCGPEQYLIADLVSSQVKLHEAYGGVVPELAAREHVLNLPLLVNRALEDCSSGVGDLSAISVTRGPGLKGCLMVGLCYAKGLSQSLGIPLLALNHIEAHIHAANLVKPAERPAYPLLALVVSGGHSMLVYSPEFRKYQVVARTRDDAAGEAFDKSATLLGLAYPGGPALSKCAERGDGSRFRFPIGLPDDPSSFSFSGLKTAVLKATVALKEQLADEQTRADLAASVENAIVSALVNKTVAQCARLNPRCVVLTGGVAANRTLRQRLSQEMDLLGVEFRVPPFRWCTDNAAMIAVLGGEIILRSPERFKSWQRGSEKGDCLGPDTESFVPALARWPLEAI